MSAAEEAKIFLKPAAHGMELPLAAEVPLANHARRVATVFESLSERGFGQRQADIFAFRRRAGIELVSEALLIAAGHQAGPRRTAIRSGDVTVSATDAVFGYRVDVRRRNIFAAVNA